MKTYSHDFEVADMGLLEWGRNEIRIAETEMPGLMAIRDEYKDEAPLKGARISGSLHMTIQTDRDAARARRRSPLGFPQYFLNAGSRGRRDR